MKEGRQKLLNPFQAAQPLEFLLGRFVRVEQTNHNGRRRFESCNVGRTQRTLAAESGNKYCRWAGSRQRQREYLLKAYRLPYFLRVPCCR